MFLQHVQRGIFVHSYFITNTNNVSKHDLYNNTISIQDLVVISIPKLNIQHLQTGLWELAQEVSSIRKRQPNCCGKHN